VKIVHVVPGLIKGGGEHVAALLANEATKSGHEVTIVAASRTDPRLLQESLHPKISVAFVSCGARTRAGRYISLPWWIMSRREWLMQQDIVHCHLTYGAVFGAAVHLMRRLMDRNGPAVVETYHAVGMPIPALHRSFHSHLATRRDALALMGRDGYWSSFASAHPELLVQIIPNGVVDRTPVARADRDAQLDYRRKIGIPEHARYVVGTVGMLRPDRKPVLYIPVFAEIARLVGRHVHFVMAGGGSELQHIQTSIEKHQLQGRVHLPGVVLEPRLPLSIIDLYVTLSAGSVAGLAAMEAAAAGLPVVGVQLHHDYESAPDDWIWSSPCPFEVAARVVELLNSPSQRAALACRQKSYVREHHSTESMVQAYAALYSAAITRARCSAAHRIAS
jgi:glycosyltransferase involved in cell wall biosynthesis